jgi:hypothetical protein
MARVHRTLAARLLLALLLAACVLVVAGCGGGKPKAAAAVSYDPTPKRVCTHPAGWQKLADRIRAVVYCPGWLPDPLTSQLGGSWNNINSVSKDRSYLESFVWQETGGGAAGGELHVNLRGYPGRTTIPDCTTGDKDNIVVKCFASPNGTVSENGIKATEYTVNQDADLWHIALVWQHAGGLYTLSEHVAPPLTYNHVVRYLKLELNNLVLIKPHQQD